MYICVICRYIYKYIYIYSIEVRLFFLLVWEAHLAWLYDLLPWTPDRFRWSHPSPWKGPFKTSFSNRSLQVSRETTELMKVGMLMKNANTNEYNYNS